MNGLLQKYMMLFLVMAWPAIAASADVYHIEIRGTINPATSHYLTRAIEKAEDSKAQFLLLELDTPGGLVSSVREMAQSMDRSRVPVVVFTGPAGASATSAGALLMISAHLAVMAPGTNIGAAHPVGAQGEDIKGAMADKAVNDIAAFARSMAELRKRNTKAAGEVVTKSSSFTADEALKTQLIDFIAKDRTELLQLLDQRKVMIGPAQVTLKTEPAPTLVPVPMSIGEQILNSLSHPNIAAILMSLGLLLIYSEISSPGLGLGGILGGLCLIIAFISFQAIPIQLGGVVLLGIGIALIIAEAFVVSGGTLALGGSVGVLLGLIWVVDPMATDLRLSPWVIGSIGLVLLSGTLLISYLVARIKTQNADALKAIGGGDLAGVRGYSGRIQSVAADGKSGKVVIRGEIWNFISREPLKEKDNVIVQASNGLTLEVVRGQES